MERTYSIKERREKGEQVGIDNGGGGGGLNF